MSQVMNVLLIFSKTLSCDYATYNINLIPRVSLESLFLPSSRETLGTRLIEHMNTIHSPADSENLFIANVHIA